jgi:nitric oxide dioxygenase
MLQMLHEGIIPIEQLNCSIILCYNKSMLKPSMGRSHVVLLGAGVGVTPMISLLKSVLEKRKNQKLVFAHAVKNSEQHAFKQFIDDASVEYGKRLKKITFYEDPLETDQLSKDYDHKGLMNLSSIQTEVYQSDADYYLCGPKPFMASLYKTLSSWGIDKSNIHYEVFGSDKTLY